MAGRALPRIAQAAVHATSTKSKGTDFFLIDGQALELWGIKTLAGLYFAKIASIDGGGRLADTHEISVKAIGDAFFGAGVISPLGLHMDVEIRECHSAEFSYAPLLDSSVNKVVGLIVQFSILKFHFFLSTPSIGSKALQSSRFHRPWHVILEGRKNFAHIVVTWRSRPNEMLTMNIQMEDVPKSA